MNEEQIKAIKELTTAIENLTDSIDSLTVSVDNTNSISYKVRDSLDALEKKLKGDNSD